MIGVIASELQVATEKMRMKVFIGDDFCDYLNANSIAVLVGQTELEALISSAEVLTSVTGSVKRKLSCGNGSRNTSR